MTAKAKDTPHPLLESCLNVRNVAKMDDKATHHGAAVMTHWIERAEELLAQRQDRMDKAIATERERIWATTGHRVAYGIGERMVLRRAKCDPAFKRWLETGAQVRDEDEPI
jgi:hypothetical protein